MLSVNTNTSALYNFHAQYLKMGKTNNTTNSANGVNDASLNDAEKTPLTDSELALAKAHIYNLQFDSVLQRLFTNKSGDERAEANDALREAITFRKENSDLFSDEIKKEYAFQRHGITLITNADFNADMERLKTNFGFDSFNLPQQGYSFDAAANAITIGKGSKVPMDGYHLWVFDYMVGAVKNGTQPPTDLGEVPFYSNIESPYVRVLNRLLGAVSNGEASWANDPEMNEATLNFLRKQGIDTSRDFRINDTVFEVKNGIIQTKGYTAPQNAQSLGLEGLNKLVLRAYEQNLLYV